VGTVVVTASAGTFSGLGESLTGFPVLIEEHPLIRFTFPEDWSQLDSALGRLKSYTAVVITSPRAARAVVDRVRATGIGSPVGSRSPVVWVSGAATAAVLEGALGPIRTAEPVEVGTQGAGAAVAQAMLAAGIAGRVLYPCGETRRDELPAQLRDRGIQVDEIVCYHTVLAGEDAARAAAARASVVVVSSPAVAQLLARACTQTGRPDLLAVGPTTADAARGAGWAPTAVAREPTVGALAECVRTLLNARQRT
jgi:uroporphyrinogen-III synthase